MLPEPACTFPAGSLRLPRAARAEAGRAARELRAGDGATAHAAGLALTAEYLRAVTGTAPDSWVPPAMPREAADATWESACGSCAGLVARRAVVPWCQPGSASSGTCGSVSLPALTGLPERTSAWIASLASQIFTFM